MEKTTLQHVIESKYNIYEPLLVEGLFVVFSENKAESIVKLGISNTSLFIASTLLSGTNIDYNLTSIKPLSSLNIHIISYGMKLIIDGPNKKENMYQLCTSKNQSKVWDKIVSCLSASPLQELSTGIPTVRYCERKKVLIKSSDRSICKCIQAAIIVSMVTCAATPVNLKIYPPSSKSKFRTQNDSSPTSHAGQKENKKMQNSYRNFFGILKTM